MFGFFEDEKDNEAYINTFRKKYPQYEDLDDQVLADALYKKDYSDLDRDKFMSAEEACAYKLIDKVVSKMET